MIKKSRKNPPPQVLLSDLVAMEAMLREGLAQNYRIALQGKDDQNLIRMDIDAVRKETLDRINSETQELKKALLDHVKEEALRVIRENRSLMHFSWEKLAETKETIIQAQKIMANTCMLVTLAQCILTFVVVGGMLWMK